MRDPDRQLDDLLASFRRHIGDLEGFEAHVGESLRRSRESSPGRGDSFQALEAIVSESLRSVEDYREARPRQRLRRLAWTGSLVAAVLVAVTLFFWYRSGEEVLASIDRGVGEFEVRRQGVGTWSQPGVPLDLGPGDEIKAIKDRPVRMTLGKGSLVVLHPAGCVRLKRRSKTIQGLQLEARLLSGGMDVKSGDPGNLVIVVKVGRSECRILHSRVQVRTSPRRGTIFAAHQGRASVRAAGLDRSIPAGTGLFVADRRSERTTEGPRITSFRLDNRALKERMTDIRDRWAHYVRKETRRRRVEGITVTLRLAPGARKLTRKPGPRGWGQVPFPPGIPSGNAVQARARWLLAVHTQDDRCFVVDSLKHALLSGLPEISGLAAQCLQLMGEGAAVIEKRIESVLSSGSARSRGQVYACNTARAVAGDRAARKNVVRGLSASAPLRTRVLAVLAVSGLQDATLIQEVHSLAEGSAGELYRDWQASTDFCDAVGLALAWNPGGLDPGRRLVCNRDIPVKSRRRYLVGMARVLRCRPTAFRQFLLDTFATLADDKMKRAVVLELLTPVPVDRNPSVAAFFRALTDQGGPLTPLAMSGMVLYVPRSEKGAVETYLLERLRNDPKAWARAAAAQAFAPPVLEQERKRGFTPPGVLRALEEALEDRDSEVRTWVARTLGAVGRSGSLTPLLEASRREADPRSLVALVRALVEIPGADRRPDVLRLVLSKLDENYSHFVRNELIMALGRLGTDMAWMILEDIVTISEDPEDRRAARVALDALRRRGR